MADQWKRSRWHRLNALARGLTLLACCASMARSQASPSDVTAAQAVGTAFLKAVEAADWKAAAGFLDVVPLDHYRLERIDAVRRMRRGYSITVEQLMKSDTLMPRAVAEYQVQRMKDRSHDFNFLEMEFGIADADSLAAMSASVVAQHWLEVHDRRWALRAAFKRSHCPMPPADSLPPAHFRILGTVVDGSAAYLLYQRDDDPPIDLDQVRSFGPSMLYLRHGLDGWWVLPRLTAGMNMVSGIGVECPVAGKAK